MIHRINLVDALLNRTFHYIRVVHILYMADSVELSVKFFYIHLTKFFNVLERRKLEVVYSQACTQATKIN